MKRNTHTLSLLSALIISQYSAVSYAQNKSDNVVDVNNNTDIEVIEVTSRPNLFGALKSNTPILETARSISIETSLQFFEKGALSLGNTLAYSAGVTSDAFGFSTRGDFVQVRGFDAPEYRDGMQSLSGNYNNTRPEIYTLEQVEVLKGPASVLFGPGSPGGIINVVTKRPTTNITNEVVLDIGSFGRRQIATDIGAVTSDEKLATRFIGLYRDSNTQIDEVNDDSIVFAPSFLYQLSDNTSVSVLLDYTKRESDTAQQFLPLAGTINASNINQRISNTTYLGEQGFNRYNTESWAVTLLGEHRFNDVWSFDLSSRYRDGESEYKQTWISFTGAGAPRVDTNGNGARSWFQQNGFSDQFQVDVRARASFFTGDIQHALLIGASHQAINSRNDSSFLYGLDGNGSAVGGVINIFNPSLSSSIPVLPDIVRGATSEDDIVGIYIHDQITINNWIINAGVRFDQVDNISSDIKSDDSANSISVSALYRFDSGISPYLNYAESFSPVVGIDSTTGFALKPQEGKQVEVGIKYQPLGTPHFFSLAYFDITLSNLSNPNNLPSAAISQQEGKSIVKGLEFEGQIAFDELSFELNASLLDSENENGFQRSSIPEQQASLWARYSPEAVEGFRVGGGIRYVGESESTDFAFGINDFFTVDTPSYTVFDVMLGYTWQDWDVTFNARNVTNKQYYATCLARGDCFAGEDGNINLRLNYQF